MSTATSTNVHPDEPVLATACAYGSSSQPHGTGYLTLRSDNWRVAIHGQTPASLYALADAIRQAGHDLANEIDEASATADDERKIAEACVDLGAPVA